MLKRFSFETPWEGNQVTNTNEGPAQAREVFTFYMIDAAVGLYSWTRETRKSNRHKWQTISEWSREGFYRWNVAQVKDPPLVPPQAIGDAIEYFRSSITWKPPMRTGGVW